MSVVYCSECGFQNPEAANYCSRCGALLSKGGDASPETTQTFSAAEFGEHLDQADLGLEGPALVVRAGGGRAGESFKPTGERTRIGTARLRRVVLQKRRRDDRLGQPAAHH